MTLKLKLYVKLELLLLGLILTVSYLGRRLL